MSLSGESVGAMDARRARNDLVGESSWFESLLLGARSADDHDGVGGHDDADEDHRHDEQRGSAATDGEQSEQHDAPPEGEDHSPSGPRLGPHSVGVGSSVRHVSSRRSPATGRTTRQR